MKKQITIGIPKALLYYKYFELWKVFFEQLGCKIIVSPDTNLAILKSGLNLAVDESCLAIKIFLGHVEFLKDKVDFVFLPRIVSLHKGEQACTKFLGLYDTVNNTFPNINILEYNVDVPNGLTEQRELIRAGQKVEKSYFKVARAYQAARKAYLKSLDDKVREQANLLETDSDLKILIVAHPYTIYDSLAGQNISKFLNKENVTLLYSDCFDQKISHKLGGEISKDLYWTYNKEFLGAIELCKDKVDGLIYAMSFPCGPDALVIDFAQKVYKTIPSLVLTIDELQGEAGLMTRLESFVDILRLKNKKKNAGK
ncbi:MAG: acyl-CoA dehydratase activase-related protein [Candidatus Berkelbacteria bacterium]|nr:acyl-CoA dehydratase activase-related protein [Candidatus Berkelbacteria bacterium]